MKSLSSITLGPQQVMKLDPSTGEDIRIDSLGEAEEMVTMLTQRIVDLSSRLLAKDEQVNHQARIAKEAMEDLIAKEEQVRYHVMSSKDEKAAREKAEADYKAVKQELEVVCQQKSLVEARVLQLNVALNECTEEMLHAKDQQEYKSQEVNIRKREWEKLRTELDTENGNLKRQLLEAAAENNAISKSLQERARCLADINDSKAKAESEAKILQVQIESLYKDMDAYKYEVHLLKKELQIRNDEKEHSKKVADATHKQHLESVKKIAKLDSECQRLRGLIRQRLPGPAAIAQMRVEADHVGKRRLPSTKSLPSSSQDQREIEALTDRLISMEDETKLLKEALVKRTAELQAARQLCARTATKLSSAEGLLETMVRGEAVPLANDHAAVKSLRLDSQQQVISSPTFLSNGSESMEIVDWVLSSEDGPNNDDELSCAESWASALIAELSHLRNEDGTAATNGNPKHVDNCKPGIVLSQEFDLQAALQELSSKLSCVGDNILALPSNLKHVVEQSNGIEATHLHLGVSQIMEVFSQIKHLLFEVGKAMVLDRNLQVMELDRSVQGSETSKTESSVVIDECDEEAKQVQSDTEKVTVKGVLSKIMELFVILVESSQEVVDGAPIGQGLLQNLGQNERVLEGGRVHDSSEEEARKVLGQLVDLLRLHYGVMDAGHAINTEGCTTSPAVDINSGSVLSDEKFVSSQVDEKLGENDMVLELEKLRLDVERTRTQLEETEGKLHAADAELEQSRDRVATLEAQFLQLQEANATVAKELVDTSALKQNLEVELLDARANLDDMRQQVSTLTSQLAEQAARCEELQGTVTSLTEAGTPARGRKSTDGAADSKARKEREVAAAKAQLAECQRTILVLGNQLRALSSAQESVVVEASFDSSLESATSTEQQNLPPLTRINGDVSTVNPGLLQLAERNVRPRRTHSGFIRTRGGRLISADQFWGSSGDIPGPISGPIDQECYPRSQGTPLHPAACYSFGSRHPFPQPHLYAATGMCLQSPLHEYITEPAAYNFSPPETALSSPAGSPARFDLHLEQSGGRRKAAANGNAGGRGLQKSMNKSINGGTGGPLILPPKTAKVATVSRIARFFTRAKNQR